MQRHSGRRKTLLHEVSIPHAACTRLQREPLLRNIRICCRFNTARGMYPVATPYQNCPSIRAWRSFNTARGMYPVATGSLPASRARTRGFNTARGMYPVATAAEGRHRSRRQVSIPHAACTRLQLRHLYLLSRLRCTGILESSCSCVYIVSYWNKHTSDISNLTLLHPLQGAAAPDSESVGGGMQLCTIARRLSNLSVYSIAYIVEVFNQ